MAAAQPDVACKMAKDGNTCEETVTTQDGAVSLQSTVRQRSNYILYTRYCFYTGCYI